MIVIVAVAIAAYFLFAQNSSERRKDDAITQAAKDVGSAAKDVGDSAKKAVE